MRRRQEPRRLVAVRIPVLVHCFGRYQCAYLRDYSQGGCSLAGVFGLFDYQRLHLEFHDSLPRIEGQVRWSLVDRIGIAFSGELPAALEEWLAAIATTCEPGAEKTPRVLR